MSDGCEWTALFFRPVLRVFGESDYFLDGRPPLALARGGGPGLFQSRTFLCLMDSGSCSTAASGKVSARASLYGFAVTLWRPASFATSFAAVIFLSVS